MGSILSNKDKDRYSLTRLIEHLSGNVTTRQIFETEVGSDISKNMGRKSRGGVFVPTEIFTRAVAKRDLNTGTAHAGGDLVAENTQGFIDILRPRTIIGDLGATFLPDLTGNLSIPRKTKASAATWVGEGQSSNPEDLNFDTVKLEPKSVIISMKVTRRMQKMSSVAVDNMVATDMLDGFAVELDRVAFAGSGANYEPLGIINSPGVNLVEIGTDGGPVDWQKVVEAEAAVAGLNGIGRSPGYATNYKVSSKLKTTSKDTGSGRFLYEGTDLNGYPLHLSNIIPANGVKGTGIDLSTLVFGSFENLLVGSWGAVEIIVDPYTLGASSIIRFTAIMDVDIAVRQPEAFSVINDISTL